MRAGGSAGLKALAHTRDHQHRVGTNSRQPHLAVMPSSPTKGGKAGPPTVVVEAVCGSGEAKRLKSVPRELALWMSKDSNTQVGASWQARQLLHGLPNNGHIASFTVCASEARYDHYPRPYHQG